MTTTQKPGKTPPKKKPVTPMTPPKKVARKGPMGDPGPAAEPFPGLDMDAMGGAAMVSPAEAIAGWLVETLEAGQVDRLELHQTGQGGDGHVKEWLAEDLADQDPDSIATDVYDTACEDGSTATRMSRYVVMAYRPGEATHFRRHFFRVAPQDKDEPFETEEANAHGLVSQAHRHTEAIMRLALGSMSSVVRSLQVQNEVKDDQLREHTKIQLDVIRLQGELVRRNQDVEISAKERNYKIERKERISRATENLVFGYLPLLTAKLGLPSPQQLMADNAAAANGSAIQQQQQGPDGDVQLDTAQTKRLHHVTKYVLDLLAEIDGAPLELMLARIPPDGRDDVRAVREIVRAHVEKNRERERNGDDPVRIQLTADQKRQLVSFQRHVVQLLGAVSDMEMAMMLERVPEAVRTDIAELRDVIRKQIMPADDAAAKK
jgi:hypothetical protein